MSIIFSLIAGIFDGAVDIIRKMLFNKNNIINILFVQTFFVLILTTFFVNDYNVDRYSLILLFLKAVILVMIWGLATKSLKELPISVITPFKILTPVLLLILSYLFFDSKLDIFQIIGFAVMSIAYIFLGKKAREDNVNLIKNKYFYMFLLTCFLAVLTSLIDKTLVLRNISIFTMLFYICVFMFVIFFLISIFTKSITKIKIDNKIILLAIVFFISEISYFYAIKVSNINLGIVSIVKRSSIIISVVLGGKIYKEKNLKEKLLYIILILFGLILISLNNIIS